MGMPRNLSNSSMTFGGNPLDRASALRADADWLAQQAAAQAAQLLRRGRARGWRADRCDCGHQVLLRRGRSCRRHQDHHERTSESYAYVHGINGRNGACNWWIPTRLSDPRFGYPHGMAATSTWAKSMILQLYMNMSAMSRFVCKSVKPHLGYAWLMQDCVIRAESGTLVYSPLRR